MSIKIYVNNRLPAIYRGGQKKPIMRNILRELTQREERRRTMRELAEPSVETVWRKRAA